MSTKSLGEQFDAFKQEAFRLETLSFYNVPGDVAEFDRYKAGELEASWNERPWIDRVRTATREGRQFRRVRLVPDVVEDYVRFEIEWAYIGLASVGEEIRFVSPAVDLYQRALEVGDFWLFDDQTAFRMRYDADRQFLKSEEASAGEVAKLSDVKRALIEESRPLTELLALMRATPLELPID